MFHTHIAKSPEHQSDAVIVDHLKTYCEANMLLPFTEYICEYDIILETSFGYDVHVTLVPKPVANHFSRLFKQAGITLTHIETAHHAVAKACLNIPTGNGVVLVSFGKTWSTVAVLHGNHCVSQQVVPVGEDTVLTTIERYLKTDRAYAEKIIARHGLLQTHPDSGLLGELYQSIDPVCRSIDHQLIALGQIPYKTFGERFSTKHVLVYGTGTHIQGLVPLIGEKTGLQALLLDIWAGRKDQRAPLLDIHAKDILSYAEPLALALVYLK
jgi:Tfp pilus assembly PilM family ATPase